MPIKCTIVERISKNGSPYQCLEIELSDTYKKTVYLDRAELELVRLKAQRSNQSALK